MTTLILPFGEVRLISEVRLSSLVPPREFDLLGTSASPGLLSTSSGVWLGEAARLEEGWIAVKRNKSKPSLPPLEMFLRSGKGVSKSKGKS